MTAGKYIYQNMPRANKYFVRRYGYVAGLLPKILQAPGKMLSAFKIQNRVIRFLQIFSGTKLTFPKAIFPTGAQTKITIFHI